MVSVQPSPIGPVVRSSVGSAPVAGVKADVVTAGVTVGPVSGVPSDLNVEPSVVAADMPRP